MNIQEAIKQVEQMGEYERFVDEPISKKSVLNILSQIDDCPKVKIPQFVADWIEEHKNKGCTLHQSMSYEVKAAVFVYIVQDWQDELEELE